MSRLMAQWARILVLCCAISACATGSKIQKLHEGMSEHDVIAVMGRPDGMTSEGEYKALKWANRLMSGWSWDRADYWVVFKRDRVVSYGPGNVRRESPGVLIIVPVGGN